jgi:Domain of unknown function (DUF4347)
MGQTYALWAYHQDLGTLCDNAQLGAGRTEKPDAPKRYQMEFKGQTGWDVALRFTGLADLVSQLAGGIRPPSFACTTEAVISIPPWRQNCPDISDLKIARLAILAHGDRPGQVLLEGKAKVANGLNAGNVEQHEELLKKMGGFLAADAEVLFMSCIAGRGQAGAELLIKLSKLWAGCKVVGFTTIGYRHPGAMKRLGEACEEVGMRETDAPDPIYINHDRLGKMWFDLEKLPWSSASTPHAKVALNGVIIQSPPYPQDEPPPLPSKKPAGATPRRR